MFKIRIATQQELKSIQQLNFECMKNNIKWDTDFKEDWSFSKDAERYYSKTIADDDSCCYLAESDGKLVGYISGCKTSVNYRKGMRAEIENIAVLPDYRKQGVATKLYKTFLTWARENSCEKVYVNTYFNNSDAVEFYKSLGFKEIDVSLEKKVSDE